jgi:plastocyanin
MAGKGKAGMIGSQAKRAARVLLVGLGLALMATPALAGSLTIRVVDSGGRPVSDAVVTLKPATGAAPRPRMEAAYRVTQQDTQFHPFVTVVPSGATVAFPNLDPFRHHVYSFSPAKRFELKLFARDQTRSVTFEQPGIVAIGCNIHDSMSAYIFVTDTVWTTRSPASGSVTFGDTPAGPFVLQVWHPYLRAPGGVLTRNYAPSAANRSETIAVALRAPPMHRMGGY